MPSDAIAVIANNLTSQVSKSELHKQLAALLAFGPRDNDYGSTKPAYKQAVEDLRKWLKQMGVATVKQKFSYGDDHRDFRKNEDIDAAVPKSQRDKDCNPVNNNSCNLCALMPGKTSNFIVAGAHLDTVLNSPGANDNGSGVVALLEAIRIFQQAKLKLNNPILFCFWGSEEKLPDNEHGTGFGSRFFLHNKGYKKVIRRLAKQASCQKFTGDSRLQCYLNLELVGTKNRAFQKSVLIDAPDEFKPKPTETFRSAPPGTQQLSELYLEFLDSRNISFFPIEPAPEKQDIGSFYAHSIPALTITAGLDRNHTCYHKSCDDMNGIDFEVLSNITQTVIYALTRLSLGEGVRTTDT